MNKTELISETAFKTGLTKKDIGIAVDGLLEVISEQLQNGEKVSLVGFGNFEVRDRAAKVGRNPQTGAQVDIPATKVPAWKPSKLLKEQVSAHN